MRQEIIAGVALAGLAAAQGPSIDAISSALGSSTSLYGQSLSLRPFTFQMIANETHAVVSFIVPNPLSSIGYVAFGTGTLMSNADMNIFWPNSDNTWTISHRTSGEHVMPTQSSIPDASDISVLTDLITTNDSTTSFSVLRKLNPSYSTDASSGAAFNLNQTNMVYAYSSNRPSSSAADATIVQHDTQGTTSINLGLAVQVDQTGNSGDVPAADQPDPVIPWSAYDMQVVAHATFGSLAWLITSPAAILVARFGKGTFNWVNPHRYLQVVTVIFTIIAFGIGIYINGPPHFESPHGRAGLTIFILIFLQMIGGWYAHHTYNPERKRRPIQNYAHLIVGLALTALGYAQVFLGPPYYTLNSGRSIPKAIPIIMGILVGLFGVAWIAGALRQILHSRNHSNGKVPEFREKS